MSSFSSLTSPSPLKSIITECTILGLVLSDLKLCSLPISALVKPIRHYIFSFQTGGYCIKKMDHHCPWINCCVGHENHCYFTFFLTSAVLGCLHASIVLAICLYHAINRVWYVYHGTGQEPMIYLTLTTLLLTLLATGMAIGVVFAVGALLYLQVRGIIRNRTTIEDWIVEKAVYRREEQGLPPFVFPYDLGWKRNLHLLFRGSRYDGIRWPIIDGCGEYDLTMEQRAQKADKRSRARLYTARRAYSGRWLPLLGYPRAALAPPCSDEPRLPLAPGQRLRATRQRRHWLFGEKIIEAGEGQRGDRGWFPRAAATPTDAPHDAHDAHEADAAHKHKPD
ncbi:unnamed protein product [Euphydryas editha]|uniref:Palmitoyltransferase n=2 Tax=Euphydryas editha TaxID=104508 RepID=A0AAU9UZX8_EUPED|nr:unnamed protein product [Euphydryas editha]